VLNVTIWKKDLPVKWWFVGWNDLDAVGGNIQLPGSQPIVGEAYRRTADEHSASPIVFVQVKDVNSYSSMSWARWPSGQVFTEILRQRHEDLLPEIHTLCQKNKIKGARIGRRFKYANIRWKFPCSMTRFSGTPSGNAFFGSAT
jgi:hypothetical protein